MRIAALIPDPFAAHVLNHVLSRQPGMDITFDPVGDCDIVLVHASLTGGELVLISGIAAAGKSVIVTSASSDSADLARYLVAGARAYHRSGEPLAKLLNVIREVDAGDLRYDPYVMECLLRHYRDMRDDSGKRIVTTAQR